MITNPVVPQFELGTLIGNLIGAAIIIAALLTFLYLILGGIQWLTSGGDKAGIEAAKSRITSAFIGLFLVMAAWVIMTLTANFFGFSFPQITIPQLGGGNQIVGGRCRDQIGNLGDECTNLNKCDKAGKCNVYCCKIPRDCYLGGTCTKQDTNCNSGLSCEKER